MFSSLSESGFIPTLCKVDGLVIFQLMCSHLFQRVASFLPNVLTKVPYLKVWDVLISFREWLHSYFEVNCMGLAVIIVGSHLFQRVASFLQGTAEFKELFSNNTVLISFREWLHSYILKEYTVFEKCSVVLISFREWLHSYCRGGAVPHNVGRIVLISFREWLHSYTRQVKSLVDLDVLGSHLFQRVASFLLKAQIGAYDLSVYKFSSLSESGFIPT